MSEKQNPIIDMELSGQDGEAREYTRKSDSSKESRHSNLPSESVKRLTSPESQESSQDGQVVLYNSTKEMVRFLPPEQGKVVEENAEAISNQVGETKVLGKKASRWGWLKSKILAPGAAGAVAGFFAKAGLHSAVKAGVRSAAEFGAVGTGAIAGGVAGGVWAGFKEYRSEGRRLQELRTYTDSLKGIEKLSDLEKIEKFVSIQKALMENKVGKDIQESLAQTEQMRELSAFVNSEKWINLKGAEKFKKILELRKSTGIGQVDSLEKKPANFWEKAEAHEKAKSEAEAIKKFQKEAQEILKDKGLSKNRKKIALAALRGATVGAVGGALGAAAFDLLADKLGFAIKEGATQAYESTKVTRDIVREKTVDSVTLKGNVWNTVKQWYLDHGVKPEKISNHLINEGMKIASEANQIEITAHHGLDHAHFDAIKDVRMEKGFQLQHMEKLNDLIKQAGGQIETEVITETRFIPSSVPETESKVPTEKIMDYVWGFGKKVIPTAILGGAGYGYYKHRKGKKQAGANAVQSEAKPSDVHEADGVYKVSKKFRMPPVGTYETEQAEVQRFEQSKAKDVFHMPGESWEPKLIAEVEGNENKLTHEIIEEVSGKITEMEKRNFSVMSHAELQAVNRELSGILDRFEVVENAVKSGQHPELVEIVGLFHGVIESIVGKMEQRLGEMKNELRGAVNGGGGEGEESRWEKKLRELSPKVSKRLLEIEKEFDSERPPIEAWKKTFYLDAIHNVISPIVKIFNQRHSLEFGAFDKANREVNNIFSRLFKKIKAVEISRQNLDETEVEIVDSEVDDATLEQTESKPLARWEKNLKKVLDVFNEYVRVGVEALFLLPYDEEKFRGALNDLKRIAERISEIEQQAKTEGYEENFKTQAEALRLEIDQLINNLEIEIKKQEKTVVQTNEIFGKNHVKLSEADREILNEAMEFGVVTKQQVEANEFGNRLNKYKLLFSVENGLIKQYFPGDFVNKSKRLKGALKAAYEGNLNKLVGFFTEYWKDSEIEDNVILKQIFNELNSHFGQPVKDAYDMASRQAQKKVK